MTFLSQSGMKISVFYWQQISTLCILQFKYWDGAHPTKQRSVFHSPTQWTHTRTSWEELIFMIGCLRNTQLLCVERNGVGVFSQGW
jgi:hypothetical protein